MKLYTSLTRLKMAMNNGVLPPMTPLTPRAERIIDPAFSIGMGALMEDAEKGLRCPVRGCGAWQQRLERHFETTHRDIGGSGRIRHLLDIPNTAKFVSMASLERSRAANPYPRGHTSGLWRGNAGKPSHLQNRATLRTTASRNLRDCCETQLKHRFIDLQNKIGRSPDIGEFSAEYGGGITNKVIRIYGTWNNGKAHFGLTTTSHKLDTFEVLQSLRAWYDVHGELPSHRMTKRGGKMPLLHSVNGYLSAFKTDHWPEAMQRAASLLNIYGGKYGLPIEHKKAS